MSILDLSPLGHQPMESVSERYVIVFNGEIYNFKVLRQDLTNLGHRFKGGSDTEVLLAAIEEYGINEAVKKGGAFASSRVGGLSGAFIPVSEDLNISEAARKGHIGLEKGW